MNRAGVLFVLVILIGGYQYWNDKEILRPRGLLVPQVPQQKKLAAQQTPIKHKNFYLLPLVEYSIQGRVLSREHYWLDKMAKVVPVDIALGWGVMSDTQVLEKLNIWQEGRFYFYSWHGSAPVDPALITRSSANMHLIPSTAYIEEEIKKLRKGQVINLMGFLVRVNYPDGTFAMSSLTREDAGAGACEIMWVQSLQIL